MEELDKNGYVKMFTQVYNELSKNVDPHTNKIITKHTFQTNKPIEERVFSNGQRNLLVIRFDVWNKIEDKVDEYSS